MNVVWKIPVVVVQLPEQTDRVCSHKEVQCLVSSRLLEILVSIRTLGLFLNRVRPQGQSTAELFGGSTCASTCWVHDTSPPLYLKRQQHGTRSGQAGVGERWDAQVGRKGENLRLYQEEGLRCHQKPAPQQGERRLGWDSSVRLQRAKAQQASGVPSGAVGNGTTVNIPATYVLKCPNSWLWQPWAVTRQLNIHSSF